MYFLNTDKNRKAIEFIFLLASLVLLLLKWCSAIQPGDDIFLFLPATASLIIMGLERAGIFPEEISVEVIATGYVYNFLIPVLKYEAENLPLYIFIPFAIRQINSDELKAMDREMKSIPWEYHETDINNPENRRLVIRKGYNTSTERKFYFDYAVTLSSLSALIEYRYAKKRNTKSEDGKNALFKTYTQTFFEIVKKELGDNYGKRVNSFSSVEDLKAKII